MLLIERYLRRSVLLAVLSAMGLLTALLGFSELLSQVGRLSASYTLGSAMGFALLKMPAYAYDVFPMALLIGVLAGLGQLASQGELTIIRASGWSAKRLWWALSKGLLGLWLVMILVGEVVAPWSEKLAVQMRLSTGAQHLSLAGSAGFWMKDGVRVIGVQSVLTAETLVGVTIYQRDATTGAVQRALQADRAVYSQEGWLLQGVQARWLSDVLVGESYSFVGLKLEESRHDSLLVSLPIEPQLLTLMSQDKKNWSGWELLTQIRLMSDNGMQTQALELAFWRKVAHPLSLMAMLALSIPLLLQAGRASSMGGRVMLGVMIGLVFYLSNRVVGDLVSLAEWPAFVGALLLPVLMLMLSLWWLKKVG